ncbi:MAG: hypothetical protein LBH03_07645 [Holophagales bacterium]|jgi:hypothetical protein|nr:hypothetical protein [Holophagales bacterium]
MNKLTGFIVFPSLTIALCAQTKPLFYKGQPYGSESQFNPIYSFLNYTLDTLQVPKSFDDENLSKRWKEVQWNLSHPRTAIQMEGGLAAFVNRQIFPYRFTENDWIPNYSLHLLGGGMTWLKNAEWFESHGFPFPRLSAFVAITAAELFQEVVEKKSTWHDDEIADVYLFRPAGILLFAWEPFARFAADTLQLQSWSYQPMYASGWERNNGKRGRIVNAGENFIVRPNMFKSDYVKPFVFFGMTNLFGLSHRANATDSISWGIGAAVLEAKPTEMRLSGGVFWDRDNSLLASLILNGTDNMAARLNIHPGTIFGKSAWSPGVYVGIGDKFKDVNFGVTIKYSPLGIAGGKRSKL